MNELTDKQKQKKKMYKELTSDKAKLILEHIENNGGAAHITTMCQVLQMKQINALPIIHNLEAEGLIEREGDTVIHHLYS